MVQVSQLPALFTEPFGNAASQINYPIADTVAGAGAASLNLGFPPAVANPSGPPPEIQDVNGILKMLAAQAQWSQMVGIPTWSASVANIAGVGGTVGSNGGYPLGAIVRSATTDWRVWRSTTNNNVTNPDSGGAGWASIVPLIQSGNVVTVASSYTVTFPVAFPTTPFVFVSESQGHNWNSSNVTQYGPDSASTTSVKIYGWTWNGTSYVATPGAMAFNWLAFAF